MMRILYAYKYLTWKCFGENNYNLTYIIENWTIYKYAYILDILLNILI